jgi:dienelactone hydrolase
MQIHAHRLLALALAAACAGAGAAPVRARSPGQAFAVGLRTFRLVDTSRSVRLPDGRRVPRTLVTLVRYPALGAPSARDRTDATPARAAGRYPLVVFGHGFRATPAIYARLLRAWSAAGYVVAAPIFPLENANAPGGPDESDLVNEPADMRFVISRLLAANARPGPLHGLIDPAEIAVAGQSDGAECAFATAYDPGFRDQRVRAAIVLSGAQLPDVGFSFPHPSPPLLAVQGSADRTNLPRYTRQFFAKARRPKFLLTLIGAGHLPPYTSQEPQLRIVERVTVAFLDRYLEHAPPGGLRAVAAAPGIAHLTSDP